MDLIWYPGCGKDFTPVLTLLSSNPHREHVPKTAPSAENPILWMTDYDPDVGQYFDRLQQGNPLPTSMCGPVPGSPLATSPLHVRTDERGSIPLGGNDVTLRDVRRFALEGAEIASQESNWRWQEWRSDPTSVPRGDNSIDRHKNAFSKFQQRRDKQLTKKELLNRYLDKNLPQSVVADVTELTLEARKERLDQPEERIKVWFSPFDSEAALEHAFKCLKVRLHTVLLVRLSGQRIDLDHDQKEFFELLKRYAKNTGTGLPEFVLTDKDTSNWKAQSNRDDPDPYQPSGVSYDGWLGPDAPIWVLRKRDGL